MSEASFKVPRSSEEITQQFHQLLFKSGDLQYKIDALKRDLALLNEEMRNLNFEFVHRKDLDAKDAEAKAKKDAEATKALESNVVPLESKKE